MCFVNYLFVQFKESHKSNTRETCQINHSTKDTSNIGRLAQSIVILWKYFTVITSTLQSSSILSTLQFCKLLQFMFLVIQCVILKLKFSFLLLLWLYRLLIILNILATHFHFYFYYCSGYITYSQSNNKKKISVSK